MSPSYHRRDFTGRGLLLPEVLSVGRSVQTEAKTSLQPHVHEDGYEICYIGRGQVDWWAPDGLYEVRAGQVYITKPAEPHGGVNSAIQPCELFWTLIRFPRHDAIGGLDKAQTRAIIKAFAQQKRRCFNAAAEVRPAFEKLWNAHDQRGPFALAQARAAMLNLLVAVIDSSRAEDDQPAPSAQIRAAVDWMEAHLTEPFNVDDAARVAGLSVNHFQTRFRQEMGLTPGEWRTRRRVREAKRLLRDPDRSVTEIAYELGFSSSQYFATVFKKVVSCGPTDYRQWLQDHAADLPGYDAD